MLLPDSNADKPSNKYNIQITDSKGSVIGDNSYVVQNFYSTPLEPQVDLIAAEEIYRQKVVDTYSWLNFSGFDSSDLSLANVSLEDVFVRLTLTVEKVIREFVESEKPSKTRRDKNSQQERVIISQQPIELGQALARHLLIVGEPGAGKSTLLRWLAVTFAKGQQRELGRLGMLADVDRLPVLVELGRLPDRYLKSEGGESPNWIQLLPEYIVSQMAFSNISPQLLSQALVNGRCLLLFDGLDEVADRQARTRLARSLAQLAHLSPTGNRVIIGSRPAGIGASESTLLPQFQRCQIERFTPEDVQRFFHFWYALDPDLTFEQQRSASDALYARVQAIPTILQLATTPLLSTILVLIWRNEGDLPERRVDLYERCCRVLIEHWEAHHDVNYQGTLIRMDWEDHLRLLMPLAYIIHSQEQRTSATRDELVPLLTQALQKTVRYANGQATATWEAKQFLNALSLRSGLLQYMGDDKYGFPHQTFQEYLVARYISEQPNPEYINLVMVHLHEAWWQEVHLLTIAHLGSGKVEASKVSELILAILHVYRAPNWLLRSPTGPSLLHVIGLGKLLPQVQLEEHIAWKLAREFEMVVRGYSECTPNGTTTRVDTAISSQAVLLVRGVIYFKDRYEMQGDLLPVVFQLLQRRGNETMVKALLKALSNKDLSIRMRAARSLEEVGIGNEMVVKALLEILRDPSSVAKRQVTEILAQVGASDERVVEALLEVLHDPNWDLRSLAVESLGQVGKGNAVALTALLAALHDTSWGVREHAVESLGRVGVGNERVVEALLETLHDPVASVRELSITSLRQIGMGDERVVKVLLETPHDSLWGLHRPGYRLQAVASLGRVGEGNERVMKSLLEALHDPSWNVREHAVAILGQMEAGNETLVNTLLEVLHDPVANVRLQVVESLGQVGAGNEKVMEALLEALDDADSHVCLRAAESLGQMGEGNERVVKALQEALHDTDNYVRSRAAESLGQMGEGNERVVNVLLEALHDPAVYVRRRVVESLGQVGAGDERVMKALREALHDGDSYIRLLTTTSLGRLEIKDTAKLRQTLVALNRFLHDDNQRSAALTSIRQLLEGRPIPGYRWVSLQKRWIENQLKRIAFWLAILVVILIPAIIVMVVLRWISTLNHNIIAWIVISSFTTGFVATIYQYRKEMRKLFSEFIRAIIVSIIFACSAILTQKNFIIGLLVFLAIIIFIAIIYQYRKVRRKSLSFRRAVPVQEEQLGATDPDVEAKKLTEGS